MRILTDLAKRCNRSLPHLEVITSICDILMTMGGLESTRTFVGATPACASEVIDAALTLMAIHKDKHSHDIFAKCCSVLWRFVQHPDFLKVSNHSYIFLELATCVIQLNREPGLAKKRVE